MRGKNVNGAAYGYFLEGTSSIPVQVLRCFFFRFFSGLVLLIKIFYDTLLFSFPFLKFVYMFNKKSNLYFSKLLYSDSKQ